MDVEDTYKARKEKVQNNEKVNNNPYPITKK